MNWSGLNYCMSQIKLTYMCQEVIILLLLKLLKAVYEIHSSVLPVFVPQGMLASKRFSITLNRKT